MDKDLVTIVIPAYNAEQFLRENIETMISQSYRNLEIIYVCDGCTDHTVEILQKYAREDARIIVQIESENHGAAVSRNIGMNMAKGEWIIFWDADDLVDHCTIAKMHKVAIEENADIVCCYWEYFDNVPSGNACLDNGIRKLYCATYPIVYTEKEQHHIMQLVDNSPCTKLIHKSIYRKEEVFFQDIPNANDFYYSMVAAVNSHKILYVDEALWYYRSNKGRRTLSTDRDFKKSYILEACDKVYEYIRQMEDNSLLLRSFYNNVLSNFGYYLDSPIYDTLFSMLRDIYLDKWGMYEQKIMGQLSYLNRALYKSVLDNVKDMDRQSLIMQAKVEFVRVLSRRGCSIWGVGRLGKSLLEQISNANIKIQHVIDSAQDKWGKTVQGYIVENPVGITTDHIIVTTPPFYDEIEKIAKRCTENIYNLERQIYLIPSKREPWNEAY